MRCISLTIMLGLAASAATADEATVGLTVPAEVKFARAEAPGGGTGSFTATVTVTNRGDQALVFSRRNFEFSVLGQNGETYPEALWGWDKPGPNEADAAPIPPGRAQKTTAKLFFHTGTPRDGERMALVLKAYDQEAKAKFKAKSPVGAEPGAAPGAAK